MNTFGSASLQFGLIDVRNVLESRQRFRREMIPALERVNHFYCPAGRWPFRGWLLMARSEYNQLNSYSTSLQLNIGDTTNSNNLATLKNLSIVQAQCVTRGLVADANALYLVELTDARGILTNRWFQFPTTSKYNIRAPAYPQTFHPGSMNSGTTWTWSTLLQDLWQQMPLLGSWPGLPVGITPAGTPENFWFSGVPAWSALCDVVEHLGLTIACDLTQTNPFTIVNSGAVDSTFTTLQTKYLPNLEDDLEWIDTGSGRVPRTINVFFRRRNSVYGTEETIRYDSLQWDMNSIYSVSVTAPAMFTNAVGTHHIWSDFTVRYDQDGNPLTADVAQAASIAQERVTQYFAKIYSQTVGFMTQTYAGALPFSTGRQVDGICWYMDCQDDDWSGWRTQIVRGPSPPWSNLWD